MRTLYYISPQIWAWKAGRRFEMARNLDALAVIFPFEVECYADTGASGRIRRAPVHGARNTPRRCAHDPAGPGAASAREQAEGRRPRSFPRSWAASGNSHAAAGRPPPSSFIQARRSRAQLESAGLAARTCRLHARRVRPSRASAVLTSSGTMSMHCALAGIPGAIVYRTDPLTYLAGRWLVRVPYLGIAEHSARRTHVPGVHPGSIVAPCARRRARHLHRGSAPARPHCGAGR